MRAPILEVTWRKIFDSAEAAARRRAAHGVRAHGWGVPVGLCAQTRCGGCCAACRSSCRAIDKSPASCQAFAPGGGRRRWGGHGGGCCRASPAAECTVRPRTGGCSQRRGRLRFARPAKVVIVSLFRASSRCSRRLCFRARARCCAAGPCSMLPAWRAAPPHVRLDLPCCSRGRLVGLTISAARSTARAAAAMAIQSKDDLHRIEVAARSGAHSCGGSQRCLQLALHPSKGRAAERKLSSMWVTPPSHR